MPTGAARDLLQAVDTTGIFSVERFGGTGCEGGKVFKDLIKSCKLVRHIPQVQLRQIMIYSNPGYKAASFWTARIFSIQRQAQRWIRHLRFYKITLRSGNGRKWPFWPGVGFRQCCPVRKLQYQARRQNPPSPPFFKGGNNMMLQFCKGDFTSPFGKGGLRGIY